MTGSNLREGLTAKLSHGGRTLSTVKSEAACSDHLRATTREIATIGTSRRRDTTRRADTLTETRRRDDIKAEGKCAELNLILPMKKLFILLSLSVVAGQSFAQ